MELAFTNCWRFGAPIPAGKVTMNDLYNIVPMTIPISTVDLTGAELQELLKDNLEDTFSADAFNSDGTHGFEGRCGEVTPPERLVHTFEWDGMPGYVCIETVTFEDPVWNNEVGEGASNALMMAQVVKYRPISITMSTTHYRRKLGWHLHRCSDQRDVCERAAM